MGTIIVQVSKDPVFRDTWGDGTDLICPHCDVSVLATDIADDQLWDILFECSYCNGLSASPLLPPGGALPPNCVDVPRGRYLLDGPVDMRRAAIAGESARERRNSEIRPKGSLFTGSVPREHKTLTPEYVLSSVQVLRETVGEPLDRLLISDALARNSLTPPLHRHPLAEVLDDVRQAAEALRHSDPVIDPRSIIELDVLNNVLHRWGRHPLTSQIRGAVLNEYPHLLVTLTAAALLEDAGNSVVLQAAQHRRAADLVLVTGPRRNAAVEIKAPRILRRLTAPIDRVAANNVIVAAVKRAGTGAAGQLSRDHPGLLLIGGFHLSRQDLDRLERAAALYLQSATARNRHRHLLGISVLSVGVNLEASFDALGKVDNKLGGIAHVRVVSNPGYKGNVELKLMPRPR